MAGLSHSSNLTWKLIAITLCVITSVFCLGLVVLTASSSNVEQDDDDVNFSESVVELLDSSESISQLDHHTLASELSVNTHVPPVLSVPSLPSVPSIQSQGSADTRTSVSSSPASIDDAPSVSEPTPPSPQPIPQLTLQERIERWNETIYLSESEGPVTSDFDEKLFHTCWTDSDFFRLNGDPVCTRLWMRKLRFSEIHNFTEVTPVFKIRDEPGEKNHDGEHERTQSNGGIKLYLENGLKAYWKPCYGKAGSAENFRRELIAMHMDRYLGFFRTPALVPLTIRSQDILRFAKELSESSSKRDGVDVVADAKTIIDKCGGSLPEGGAEHDVVDGVLVGWSNLPLRYEPPKPVDGDYPARLDKLKYYKEQDLRKIFEGVSSESKPEDLRWPLETVAINMFGAVTGYMSRFKHNIFTLRDWDNTFDGPYSYIDNDRSSWSKKTQDKNELLRHSLMWDFCKFPKSVAERFLLLYENQVSSSAATLSTLQKSTSIKLYPQPILGNDTTELDWLPDRDWKHLDSNVKFIAKGIQNCLEQHDQDFVLIKEPWRTNYEDCDIAMETKLWCTP